MPGAPGNGGEELTRVRSLRVVEDPGGRSALHDLSVAHHREPVADLRRDAQVVGDEDHREVHAITDLVQQPQDLRLDGHVERGHRLVGDQHVRLQRQRAGDADPLALAAGELVREAVVGALVQADDREQLACVLLRLGAPGRPGSAGPGR